jgi:hypothetical protein
MGVTERDGAQAHAVLDELVTVCVPDVRALPANENARRLDRKLVGPFRIGV